MLFFTDGDEAPKVNPINKLELTSVQIGKNVIFVGVGGDAAVPIPRYNAANKWVGFWPYDAKEMGVSYSDPSMDEPDPAVAYARFDRYLSKLDADYLKSLANEIKGKYVEGQDTPEFYKFIQEQKPAASFVTGYSMRWVYLNLAGLMILITFVPNMLHRWRARN